MSDKTFAPTVMRSMLGRARGLGSAKSGTAHWWAERVTAAALVPLSLWFVFSIFRLEGAPRAAVAHWAAWPVNATLLAALVLTTFHHVQLGLQAVIDDYIHGEAARLVVLLAMRAGCVLLALAALIAVLKLAFTG
ncbi:MAG: succinate dehydrogenase, hydrophobic membrane anchor protein [Rhodospirillales bacterium]|nr:succinate dehydrogenase, hydrophobic membrane anchor protein [Rhodospirillales bacterium]MDE2200213.1 succinate dehydrogenase, hydrophobic membrane anchor protein [Rhodospirillales bacterium]MDE2576171.1 succinate dehydrogenase, hydrophobic membrane anchor protein [Rhodospirillales bacterium]